MIVVSLSI